MFGLMSCVLLILSPVGDPVVPRHETVTRTGKVILLVDLLKDKGIATDSDSISRQVVLVEADGSVTPLLSDEASRAFFLDDRLRGRKAELVARKFAGLPYLQLVSFKIEDDGRLRIPEYWCDVCSISVRYPQTCPCCQGPMELRMRPEKQ